jgi:hypothetical protein
MNAVFRSKIDGGFIWIALAMPAVAFVALFTAPQGNRLLWIPVGLLFLATVTIGWIFVATYYELTADQLVTRCGPFTWRIPLAEVSAIRESNSARSGPALSLDRMEIVYGDGKVLVISPTDKGRFVAAVHQRVAALRSAVAGPKSEP